MALQSEEEEQAIEQEENRWEQIYLKCAFTKMGGILTGTFYQTYGGGPEGGYVVNSEAVFEVERNWGNPWKAQKLPKPIAFVTKTNADESDECMLLTSFDLDVLPAGCNYEIVLYK